MSDGLIPGHPLARYGNANQVAEVYKQTNFRHLTVAEKVATFSDPSLKTFESENIVKAYLVGCGENRDATWAYELHRGIAPIMEQIFREILAAGLDYRIRSLHGYAFRYVKDSIKPPWLFHPDYAGLAPNDSCNVTYAQRDREMGRMHVKLDGEFRGGTPLERFDRLSNHAYGSAIDINARTNEFKNDGLCDMHPEIVRIFQNYKFFWGGFYSGRRDYMHFEYADTELDLADEIRKSFFFPIKLGSGKNPALYYDNNESTSHADLHEVDDVEGNKAADQAAETEYKKAKKANKDAEKPEPAHLTKQQLTTHTQTTEGGFYPIALPASGKSSLHGGIHLAAVRPKDLVRAMAPGSIVAVRLADVENQSVNKTVCQSLRNWNNFVLVKHEVSPNGRKDHYPLYSLYMHLAGVPTPAFGNAPQPQKLSGPIADIPWLRSLYLGRYGVLIRVSDAGAPKEDPFPLGTCLWPAEPLKDSAGKEKLRLKALSLDGSCLHDISLASEPDANKLTTRWWEWKPPSPQLDAFWEDLREGKVLTFDRPFLPVKAGDVVGHTDDFGQGHELRAISDGFGGDFKILNRLMHWEVFGEQGEKGSIKQLIDHLELLSDSKIKATDFPTVASADPAKAFMGNELRDLLPKESAPELAAGLPNFLGPSHLIHMYNAGVAKGAPVQFRLELRHLQMPSKCNPRQDKHIFRISAIRKQKDEIEVLGIPLLLHITETQAWFYQENVTVQDQDLLPPLTAVTPEHWARPRPTPGTPQKTLDFFLTLPLATEKLLVENVTKGSQLGGRETPKLEQDFERFKRMTSRQWRNVVLDHASDWVPEANKEALGDGVKEATPPGSLAWWDPQAERMAFGSTKSLFAKGRLPQDGKIQNMHPVTLKWMLEILNNHRLEEMSRPKSSGAAPPQDDDEQVADGSVGEKDKIWPLFRDPLDRSDKGDGEANSVVDPVGVGVLVRDAKVALDQPILVVLADDYYRMTDPSENQREGQVRFEKLAPVAEAAPIQQTPAPSPTAALLSRPASDFSLDSLKEKAKSEAMEFGMTTLRDAAKALKDKALEAFDPSEWNGNPDVVKLHIPEILRFSVDIAGTGIGGSSVGADFWGRWKIFPDHDSDIEDTKTWGLDTIEIAAPDFGDLAALMDQIQPKEGDPGVYTWTVPWVGKALRGGFRVLVELIRIADGKRQRTGVCEVGYSLPGKDPDSQILEPAKWIMDPEYLTGPTPEALADQKKAPAPAEGAKGKEGKGKKTKGPPPLMVTSEFAWNEIAAALPKKGRIHRRLLRALNDLALRCKADFKLLSIDGDGNGCVVSASREIAGSVSKVDAFTTFVPVKGAEKDKTKKYRLAIPPFADKKLTFAFDPRHLLQKYFGEYHPEHLGGEIGFDLHFVRGFGRNHGTLDGKFALFPKNIPEGSVVTRSYPMPVTTFGRAFGRSRLTPNWTATKVGKKRGRELTWTAEVELLGETSLWQEGDIQMRLCGKSSLLGGPVDNTPWQGAVVSGGCAHAVFAKGKSKVAGFLERGRYSLEIKFVPRITAKAKQQTPRSKQGLLDSVKSGVSGMFAEAEAAIEAEFDLTPSLGEPRVEIEGENVSITMSTTGLFTTTSVHDPDGIPPDSISGLCRMEIEEQAGLPVTDPAAGFRQKLPGPDHVLRWELHLPPGNYSCKFVPPSKVRETSMEARSTVFTIPEVGQP